MYFKIKYNILLCSKPIPNITPSFHEVWHLLVNVHSSHISRHTNCMRNSQPERGLRLVELAIILCKICTFQYFRKVNKLNTYQYQHLCQNEGYCLNGKICKTQCIMQTVMHRKCFKGI